MRMHQSNPALQLPCACTVLRKASRAITSVYDDALSETGLSTPQLAILRAIHRDNGLPLTHLAKDMVMDRTSLYRALAPMVSAGWVRVEASNGRTKLAFLTDAGRAIEAEAAPRWDAIHARVVEALGVERWRDLSTGLKALADLGVALAP